MKVTLNEGAGGQEVRYVSGGTEYCEDFSDGRLVGWFGSSGSAGVLTGMAPGEADGDVGAPRQSDARNCDSFEIRIKTEPTAPHLQGMLLSDNWHWESFRELPCTGGDSRHVLIELFHAESGVRIGVNTLLDGTPIMKRWLDITNESGRPLAITELVPWRGRLWSQDAPITIGHATRWEIPWEAWFDWTVLHEGLNTFRNTEGLSWDSPYFVARNDASGGYFFGQLEWSVNYVMEFDKASGLDFKIGPTAVNALLVMSPGETTSTPGVHLGYVDGDFDQTVQAMHEHIRKSVRPKLAPERSYLSQYLLNEDWPACAYRGKEFNEVNVRKCIDLAAAAGIELFILDSPMWGSSLGNWLVANPDRFPNGIAALADYAHSKGLLFGLYAEPEGGRGSRSSEGCTIGPFSNCKAYQEHPEWFLKDGIHKPELSPRDVLNLSNPEAAQYMETEICRMVDHYHLDLYRHDFNAQPEDDVDLERDGFVENHCWRHYEAFWKAFEHIHAKYPDLILQQAAGGGRRSDLGTVGRFHENFASDRAQMPWVIRMLSGFSVFLPSEVLVNVTGMAMPNFLPDLDTMLRTAYALGNTPMIFNAVLPEFAPGNIEKFAHYAGIYKSFIRPMLPTCEVWHHAPVNATDGVDSGDWFAMEFTSPDKTRGWATIIRARKHGFGAYLFKPSGLNPDTKYSVTFDNTGETIVIDGGSLMRDGLYIEPSTGWRSELLLFNEC